MYLPLGRQGVRLVAQVPGHNKKALRRGGNIIAPFCLPVNRYLKICPTTAHFFAAGSRAVPGGGRRGGSRPPTLPSACFPAPIPPTPFPAGRGESQSLFRRGLRPRHPCTEPARHWLDLPIRHPAGGTMVLVAGRFFTLAVFLPPFPEGDGYPPAPFPAGRGRFLLYFAGGYRPRHPCIRPPAALIVPAKQAPGAEGSLCFGAKQTEPPIFGQCRQPRRGGTGGDGTIRRKRRRRLRWSSPPGLGEQVPLGFISRQNHCPRTIFRPSLDNRTEVWYTRDTTIETR